MIMPSYYDRVTSLSRTGRRLSSRLYRIRSRLGKPDPFQTVTRFARRIWPEEGRQWRIWPEPPTPTQNGPSAPHRGHGL